MNRERALKILLVLVGLLFSAVVYFLARFLWEPNPRGRFADDAQSLCRARDFSAAGSAQPIGQSEPDRFHRVVEFCSRRGYGGAGIP